MNPQTLMAGPWPMKLAKSGLGLFCLALLALMCVTLITQHDPSQTFPLTLQLTFALAVLGQAAFVGGSLLAPLVDWHRSRASVDTTE